MSLGVMTCYFLKISTSLYGTECMVLMKLLQIPPLWWLLWALPLIPMPSQLFWASVSSHKKERFETAALRALQGGHGYELRAGQGSENSLGHSQVFWPYLYLLSSLQGVCCFKAGTWVWDVCLLFIFPAASLTSRLAYVYQSPFIKLVYEVLNKQIKEMFWMSLSEQTNRVDGSSDTEKDLLLAGGFYFP